MKSFNLLAEKLRRAIEQGDFSAANDALDAGAPVDEPDNDGELPLMHAIAENRVEIVRELLRRGAPVDSRGDEDYTPLMVAAGVSPKIVSVLLDARAEVNAVNSDGYTALDLAHAMEAWQSFLLIYEAGGTSGAPSGDLPAAS